MSEAVLHEPIRIETGEELGQTLEFGRAIERPGGRETDYLASHEFARGERVFVATDTGDTGVRPRGGDSLLAANTILKSLEEFGDLAGVLRRAHQELIAAGERLGQRPMQVAAGIVLVRQDKAEIVLSGRIQALLVREGVIKRYLASGEDPFPLGVSGQEPQITREEAVLQDGDLIILATDGVSDLGDEEILQTIQESGQNSARDIAGALTQKAVKKAALDPEQVSLGVPPDNASAFVIRAEKPEAPERTWEDAVGEVIELSEQLERGFNPQGEEREQTLDSHLKRKRMLEELMREGKLSPQLVVDLKLILEDIDTKLRIS